MGIYDKQYHIRDTRRGWTDEEIAECNRIMREEQMRAPQIYCNDRHVAKEDYNSFMAELAPKIPPSLCGSVFLRKVKKWLVG